MKAKSNNVAKVLSLLVLVFIAFRGEGAPQSVEPTRVGQWSRSPPDFGSAYAVAVSGHYAYVAPWDTGLQVIDVSDPATPMPVASAIQHCSTGQLTPAFRWTTTT